MRIVVPKLQTLISPVTRRVVLLVHCNVPTVPISPQNRKLIWITILLRSTAPQNLMSLSSVNFVIKSFPDFTPYVNIETFNTGCKSDPEQEVWMWNLKWEMWRITGWEKSCVLVSFFGGFRTWKSKTQSIQLFYRELHCRNCRRKTWSFPQQPKVCSESESGFWCHFE